MQTKLITYMDCIKHGSRTLQRRSVHRRLCQSTSACSSSISYALEFLIIREWRRVRQLWGGHFYSHQINWRVLSKAIHHEPH